MNGQPDAVVVGAGPNGLAAALRLAAAGLRVQVVEAADRPGGGMRTEELIRARATATTSARPCSRWPRRRRSSASSTSPSRGVRLVQPEINFAHPLDGGRAAVSRRSLEETAAGLGRGRGGLPPAVRAAGRARHRRRRLLPHQPAAPAAHPQRRRRSRTSGSTGCPTCAGWRTGTSDTEGARALIGGAAAHGMLDLTQPLTSALGMLLDDAVATTSAGR